MTTILPATPSVYFDLSITVHGSEEQSFSPYQRAKEIAQERTLIVIDIDEGN